MDQQNGLFFTIWYGIYHRPTRRLDYAGGGHPPALLLTGPTPDHGQGNLELDSGGPMVGRRVRPRIHHGDLPGRSLRPALALQRRRLRGRAPRRLDLALPRLRRLHGPGLAQDPRRHWMDQLIRHARAMSGSDEFADDLSMVEFLFPPPG